MKPNIVDNSEDDNSVLSFESKKLNFSELEKAKLLSCVKAIRNIIGNSIAESKLEEEIICLEFNFEVALDKLLNITSKY